MQIDEVLAAGLELDGIRLSLAGNEALLQWPGRWVVHAGGGGASHRPEVRYPEQGLLEQGYTVGRVEVPVGRRIPSPAPVPEKAGEAWRAQFLGLLGEKRFADPSPFRPGYARPHAAAQWDAQQAIRADRPLVNPYDQLLEQLELPPPRPRSDTDGATWVLGQISLPLLKTVLIRPTAVEILTPSGAGQALARYLLTDRNPDEIKPILLQVRQRDLDPMFGVVNRKLTQIRDEAGRWIEAGRPPVVGLDGQVDRPLTLANIATVAVAVHLLGRLQTELVSFRHSAAVAYQGVIKSVT